MPIASLVAIYVAPSAGAEMVSVPSATLELERGIVGDRYHAGVGSFSRWPGDGRHVTLIEQEVIDAVLAETGIDLTRGQSRRNLVSRDVRLLDLNGKVFRIGTTILRGTRECAPCGYLQKLIGPGLRKALLGRGGLRANVLQGGEITIGDSIEPATYVPPVKARRH